MSKRNIKNSFEGVLMNKKKKSSQAKRKLDFQEVIVITDSQETVGQPTQILQQIMVPDSEETETLEEIIIPDSQEVVEQTTLNNELDFTCLEWAKTATDQDIPVPGGQPAENLQTMVTPIVMVSI